MQFTRTRKTCTPSYAQRRRRELVLQVDLPSCRANGNAGCTKTKRVPPGRHRSSAESDSKKVTQPVETVTANPSNLNLSRGRGFTSLVRRSPLRVPSCLYVPPIHKARHRVTGKTVAIKRVSSADASELQREAGFLKTCSGNPYVVGFEGLLRDPTTGGVRLVMECVDAPSLHAFLWDRRHCPPLPESKVRAFMWKLLTGAKMMHDRHVVHRDIKPANILVGQDGQLVKICDLGLAISMCDSPPYTYAGTLPYMAPEMLLQKPDYDALVDTWSLGCVMAEMLTGETLFDDDDHHQDEFKDAVHLVQIWRIFRVLGTPDERTWPEFTSLLPLTPKALQLLPAGHNHSKLRDIFPQEKLSEQGFQVLQGLLTCNPDKRLTAAKALKLPWFAAPLASAAATSAKVQASPLQRKKTPRFQVPLAVWKAQAQRV